MHVAVLRCRTLPSFVTWDAGDVEQYLDDDRLLISELEQRGVSAESVVWSDPDVDWDRFDVALLRSTWDYIDHHDLFLSTLTRIESSRCTLVNPLDAVRWSTDKAYLFDLADWGVPVVPTHRASGTNAADLEHLALREAWTGAVLKPAVGGGAAGVSRLDTTAIASTLLAESRPLDGLILQPLVGSVLTEGEWSFIFLGDELSHVLLKKPAAGDYRAHGIYGGSVEAIEPSAADVRQARTIRSRLPFALTYARLDLVRVDGRLAVMEVELVEPMLYFPLAPEAAGRLARATVAVLGPATDP